MKRQKVRSKMGVKEKALTAASSIASGDFLRMVTSAGAARKIDYSKLAKAIVEEYNGSTIAGSAQTLKAALDSLNSKMAASEFTELVNNNVAASGDSDWHTASDSIPSLDYNYLFVKISVHGATMQSAIIDVDALKVCTSPIELSAYWDSTNIVTIRITRNGAITLNAKTRTYAADYYIAGIK